MDVKKLRTYVALQQNRRGHDDDVGYMGAGTFNTFAVSLSGLAFLWYWHPIFYVICSLSALSTLCFYQRKQLQFLIAAQVFGFISLYLCFISLPFLIFQDHGVLQQGSGLFIPFIVVMILTSFWTLRGEGKDLRPHIIRSIQAYGPFAALIFNDVAYQKEYKKLLAQKDYGITAFWMFMLYGLFVVLFMWLFEIHILDLRNDGGALSLLLCVFMCFVLSIRAVIYLWSWLSIFYYQGEIRVYFEEPKRP